MKSSITVQYAESRLLEGEIVGTANLNLHNGTLSSIEVPQVMADEMNSLEGLTITVKEGLSPVEFPLKYEPGYGNIVSLSNMDKIRSIVQASEERALLLSPSPIDGECTNTQELEMKR